MYITREMVWRGKKTSGSGGGEGGGAAEDEMKNDRREEKSKKKRPVEENKRSRAIWRKGGSPYSIDGIMKGMKRMQATGGKER